MTDKKIVSEFVKASGADAIPLMHRMLYIDRTITDINVRDSTDSDYTALHYQAHLGTMGSLAWLLRQDPPPDVDVLASWRQTPLMLAVYSNEDPEGKVCLLLDHGADRTKKNAPGSTALDKVRWNRMPAAFIDMLKNYRSDVSR